ncbi:MAG: glycosyl hydrolase [Segetibacter sp.]
MKKILLSLLSVLTIASVYAQAFVTSVEAEAGVLTGVTIAPQAGASSGPYVTGFDTDGDKVTVTVNVPAASNYKLEIRYRASFGTKTQDVYANNSFVGNVVFPQSADFVNLNAVSLFLNAGNNTIAVQKNWGFMDVDKLSLYTIPANVYNITTTLIDPQASSPTNSLYNFMRLQFGKKIISGQTNDYYDSIKNVTGRSPLLRAWDMQSYSPMYTYKWVNNGHAFGAVDNRDAEKAITWYNSTSKKGIVSFHWHWHSPSGGTAGKNTFYTTETTFDVSQAVIGGTQQNAEVLRDIDAIAEPLKKLRDADVPVLWRPLHEAGGRWFWWGAKGSAPAKALWDIMYDRLTNFHGLHNLIWIWSSPEADWYPGNSKVDMIGYDSYPGNYNYTMQKNMFDNLYNITNGQKLIALTENGPIPDIQNSLSADAPWSYFMAWNDLVFKQNTLQHIREVYTNPNLLTLENYATALPIVLSGFNATAKGAKTKIDWFTSSEQNNDRFEIERSSDGINYFKLAMVKGKGNSSTGHQYIIYDNNPLKGTNYYRLLQYNLDGGPTVHGVEMVSFNVAGLPTVKVYPNPSTRNLGIVLSNYEGKKVSVSIADISGKIISTESIQTNNGPRFYKLNTSRTMKGHYILHVTGEGLQQSIKVIMQ